MMEIFPRELIAAFGKKNVMFARTEDMLKDTDKPRKGGFLERLARFLGLKDFKNYPFKAMHRCESVDRKGRRKNCKMPLAVYPISGNRDMLPETRTLIYLHFYEECLIMKQEFGVVYTACLNVLPNTGAGNNGDKTEGKK
jgi:hypothetical protein